MENQETIIITNNELRSLLIDIRYNIEIARDLIEKIGDDELISGGVGYKAGQIYRLLDYACDRAYDVLDTHVPYIEENTDNESENI